MNPLQLLKIYRRAQKLAGFVEEAKMSKSLFASKLFWFNVLSASAAVLGVIPLPPEYVAVGTGVINIALRFVTKQPVHVVPQ